ncbi:MAG TPA: diguanylate cyclase [Lacipirellulaceae bacterium]|nr:diguanylate cyclase [Lacipirellulaceae bacterium]
MLVPLASMLPNVLIDVALGLSAFFTGFVAALSYHRFANPRKDDGPSEAVATPQVDALANEAARTNMAAQQLRDLAQNVASDVGAHNILVGSISDQLDSIKQGDNNSESVVRDAVAKMLDANKKLATRLEDAERKIQIQAEEIRTQQSEARTDALTHLANRRAFDACLDENMRRFQTDGRPFSMLIFDVDHFKQFNDVHGHQAGDEVLRCVGRTLARIVKSGDLPCRYGGEEFAIIMANTSAAEGQIAAERVRRAIEGMAVQFAGKTLRVTASIGLAESDPAEDGAQLLRRADDCVYASKKAGRNCSHWHNGTECLPIATPAKQPAAAKSEAPHAPRIPQLAPLRTDMANIPDRTAFSEELRRRIASSHRTGEPVSVLHFRVKEFARLETTYGAAVGALLLDSLATFIASTLRDMDLLGKLEAGEFVVMLPGSSASAAKIVGQRVRSSISLCPIPMGAQQIRLELDLGVVSVQPDDDATSAIARAKEELEASAAAEADQEARRLAELSEKTAEKSLAAV